MCSCQQHSQGATETSTKATASDLAFTVEDMTCGHCAGTIKSAIETALPGTSVEADPASKLVSVKGANDYSAIKSIIAKAGYTPSPELAAA
jgi:copper chaperone